MIKITWPPLDLPPIWFCSYSSFSIMTELSFASVVSGLCRLESTCSDFFFNVELCPGREPSLVSSECTDSFSTLLSFLCSCLQTGACKALAVFLRLNLLRIPVTIGFGTLIFFLCFILITAIVCRSWGCQSSCFMFCGSVFHLVLL